MSEDAGAPEVLGLFTDAVVDLETYAGGTVVYRVPDVRGEQREFRLPSDPPFEAALAFLRAHDGWLRARIEYPKTARRSEEEAVRRLGRAWEELVEAFARILRIHHEEVTAPELRASYGQQALGNWMVAYAYRLQFAAATDVEAALAALLGERETPKAARPRPSGSGRRSGPSGGGSAGTSTTGGGSAGASSGPPAAS
ncbi:MAG TPA: hypothetical protein VNO79_00815 [Actinomycetota bacterium]|nr:hypothetical protein [Actinomycetota bacterium]